MDYAHVFRRDKLNHVVVNNRPRIERNGRHITVCGKAVDKTFQRRISGYEVIVPVTCPTCLLFVVTLMDWMEGEWP